MLKNLLKGQGTGTPLLLAWVSGFIGYIGLLQVLSLAGIAQNWRSVCWMGLSAWTATLLMPTFLARIDWMLVLLFCSLSAIGQPSESYNGFEGAALLQTFLLADVRKRAWTWFLLVSIESLVQSTVFRGGLYAYKAFVGVVGVFIPAYLIVDFPFIYFLTKASALGAVAAFLMPPIKKSSSEEE